MHSVSVVSTSSPVLKSSGTVSHGINDGHVPEEQSSGGFFLSWRSSEEKEQPGECCAA